MAASQRIEHPLQPVFDARSRVLVLGTMPSPASRTAGFYYGHPQNRFWKVVAAVFGQAEPVTVAEKKAMLLSCRVAVWDVIESCDIIGASDSSVKNAVPADVASLLKETGIRRVYVNGALAGRLYDKFLAQKTGIEAVKLPSTSPANARYRLDDLIESWQIIRWEDC